MTQAEDKDLSKDEKSMLEETILINKKASFGHNGSRVCAEDLKGGLSTRLMFQEIWLEHISIAKPSDRKKC